MPDFADVLLFLGPSTDKAEGNKFAKDFEENSQKLQEFVGFLEKELKSGPPLIDALGNADIFYEMQYKEVKIVANVSGSLLVTRSSFLVPPSLWLLSHLPPSRLPGLQRLCQPCGQSQKETGFSEVHSTRTRGLAHPLTL